MEIFNVTATASPGSVTWLDTNPSSPRLLSRVEG